MKRIINPSEDKWISICQRPAADRQELEGIVRKILAVVKDGGDKALLDYSEQFDKVRPSSLGVSKEEIASSTAEVSEEIKGAIAFARRNIEKFHTSQLIQEPVIETVKGVRCWRKNVAIEKIGLYIPGGSAPLFSTVLMLGIPAKIAGCREIVLCTPPDREGRVNPLILYTADLLGISEIFKVGGAQAIAAMAYGTETIPKVSKIFGPGNQYVSMAKELVQQDGIAIDLPAGPSEVLVIADEAAAPEYIAADLLSQAEHGPDSQVVLVTDSRNLIEKIEVEIEKQLKDLPRQKIAIASLKNSWAILFDSLDKCMDFSNNYSPEHLIINTNDNQSLSEKVINAGSVFLGRFSCESAGDYASGTNHTLPTNGFAKSYSGVSADSFVKKITYQEVDRNGIEILGPPIMAMAEAELLQAHSNAVSIRLNNPGNDRNR